jgi:hypothetical protein
MSLIEYRSLSLTPLVTLDGGPEPSLGFLINRRPIDVKDENLPSSSDYTKDSELDSLVLYGNLWTLT